MVAGASPVTARADLGLGQNRRLGLGGGGPAGGRRQEAAAGFIGGNGDAMRVNGWVLPFSGKAHWIPPKFETWSPSLSIYCQTSNLR